MGDWPRYREKLKKAGLNRLKGWNKETGRVEEWLYLNIVVYSQMSKEGKRKGIL